MNAPTPCALCGGTKEARWVEDEWVEWKCRDCQAHSVEPRVKGPESHRTGPVRAVQPIEGDQ